MILLACVLALGGWLVVAPAVATRKATSAEQPIGVTAIPEARGMATEPARSPNAPVPAVAATIVQDEKVRCGFDQRPEATDPLPDADGVVRELPELARPAGVVYAGAQRRRDAALRSTGDPFDQAVADALNVDDLRSLDDRLATLVRDAADGNDPRIDQLAFGACLGVGSEPAFGFRGVRVAGEAGRRACAQLDPRRWASHDPGNAVPWFYVLQRADQSGDLAAQREALGHLASSSTYDSRWGAAALSVARLPLPDEGDLGGVHDLVLRTIAYEPSPPFQAVTGRCRDKAGGDAALADQCERIADLLDRSSEFMPRLVGASIHDLATGDPRRLEKVRVEQRELLARWSKTRDTEADFEKSPCDAARRTLRHLMLSGRIGERAAMLQEIESAAQVTPPEPSRTPARTSHPASSRS